MARSRTSFVSGHSGNPGGRPKAALDVQELARAATPAAIKALVDALSSPRERVSAAVALLDRALGKPTQPLAGDNAAGPLLIDFKWADSPVSPSLIEATADDAKMDPVATWGSSC